MKISVNDIELFSLTDTQKKVMQNDINADIFDEDMKRRILYVILHKYDQCYKRLIEEWSPKLKGRVNSFPTSEEQFANLIFSQPEYKSKKARDLELEKKPK